jgi:hypothetical protein
VFADSGNGSHLLYRIDLPNDADALRLVKGVLEAIAAKFSGEGVDVGVGRARRISTDRRHVLTLAGVGRPEIPSSPLRRSKLLPDKTLRRRVRRSYTQVPPGVLTA